MEGLEIMYECEDLSIHESRDSVRGRFRRAARAMLAFPPFLTSFVFTRHQIVSSTQSFFSISLAVVVVTSEACDASGRRRHNAEQTNASKYWIGSYTKKTRA